MLRSLKNPLKSCVYNLFYLLSNTYNTFLTLQLSLQSLGMSIEYNMHTVSVWLLYLHILILIFQL